MKTIFRLIVCLLLIMGWGLAALSLHVIRTPDEIPITLVPKERLGVTDTYVDTRTWTVNEAAKHPALVQKLINLGKADVLRHVAGGDVKAAATNASTTPSGADLIRVLGDALRSAQPEAQNRSTQPSSNARGAHGLLGWF